MLKPLYTTNLPKTCPCDLKLNYLECCGNYIETQHTAPDALSLMRSRYSAYSLAKIDYIYQTMRESAQAQFDPQKAKEWAKNIRWLNLVIEEYQLLTKTSATVTFIANYIEEQSLCQLEEISIFSYIDGAWYYVRADQPPNVKRQTISRKQSCPCGSQKKFKHCCASDIKN